VSAASASCCSPLLLFAWTFAATLFLVFAGMLLAVALNAMTNLLGRVVKLAHTLRLTIVCLRSQRCCPASSSWRRYHRAAGDGPEQHHQVATGERQSLPRKNGIDTSYLDFGERPRPRIRRRRRRRAPPNAQLSERRRACLERWRDRQPDLQGLARPSAWSSSFFIVLFLGLAFAAQPSVYRSGLLFIMPAKHRARATIIVDRIGDTLERWLIAQIVTMAAVFFVTWIGLAIIGIQSSFILGIQAGLLAFIPTVGAIIAGLIVVLASLASGWIAALSAFILFLGVHAMESYVLTPIIQRQALDIPPATLFAFQILLGVVFGIWGLALALPLMAIAKVMIDHFKTAPVEEILA
jgi:predicted PurR-regulated permease PerM